MKIGILTGGGDCPGLNAVIRAVVRKGIFHYSDQFVGFLEGWRGVQENMVRLLDLEEVAGILPRGGTILRSSRTNPAKKERGLEQCIENLNNNGIEALVVLGGDDTQSVSQKLFEGGVKVVAVPKTIDNDLSGTDFCFGFDTAVMIATEAIDRVHTTAEAHNRVIVVEVMDLVHEGKFGNMVVLRGNAIQSIPIIEAISKTSYVSQELIDVALSLQDRRGEERGGLKAAPHQR